MVRGAEIPAAGLCRECVEVCGPVGDGMQPLTNGIEMFAEHRRLVVERLDEFNLDVPRLCEREGHPRVRRVSPVSEVLDRCGCKYVEGSNTDRLSPMLNRSA